MRTRLLRKLSGLMGHFPHLLPHSVVRDKRIPIEGVAHQCGTVRFGDDPRTSALNVDCRAHDLDNLYVVDTSFFRLSRDSNGIASTIGRGLAAGLAGTAAMTISSTIEQKLRGRAASTAPADAAAKVLGIREFPSDDAKNAFSNAVHWTYGTGWGAVRALLGTRLSPGAATATHVATLWGTEQVMLPALEVAPPVTMWGREEIAIDGFHHLVYATVTGISYELLSARH